MATSVFFDTFLVFSGRFLRVFVARKNQHFLLDGAEFVSEILCADFKGENILVKTLAGEFSIPHDFGRLEKAGIAPNEPPAPSLLDVLPPAAFREDILQKDGRVRFSFGYISSLEAIYKTKRPAAYRSGKLFILYQNWWLAWELSQDLTIKLDSPPCEAKTHLPLE